MAWRYNYVGFQDHWGSSRVGICRFTWWVCVCVHACMFWRRLGGVKKRGILPGLDSALLGEGVYQRDRGTHFLNSGNIVARDFLWSRKSGSSLFAPAAPLGKVLGQEELLGWEKGEIFQVLYALCFHMQVRAQCKVPAQY